MRVPLFPLSTVLFPGGVLPLRVFEARYMDMTRDCMKRGAPFGVCLIRRGAETESGVQTEEVGCLAHIAAWDMQQLGVLLLRTIGGQRFRIVSTTTQADGLIVGDVELLAADDDLPLPPDYTPCVDLLRRVIDDLAAQRAAMPEGERPMGDAFEPPWQLDSTVWVGNRLCEVLPVPLKAKQKLMELDDARTRLSIVSKYLKQHAVIK